MKPCIRASLILLMMAIALSAADDEWMTDHAKALEKAKAEKKLIFMDFSGSDWCGWCIRLDEEILSKEEFKYYAEQNLVLLKVDFPKRKALPAELKAQNEKLAEQYKIEGFPTIVVLDPDGKEIGRLGYMEGGPAAFVTELKKLRK